MIIYDYEDFDYYDYKWYQVVWLCFSFTMFFCYIAAKGTDDWFLLRLWFCQSPTKALMGNRIECLCQGMFKMIDYGI